MNTPGDGDVTCWKCGHHYALQRKFCVKCGSKPTRPGSTPGSPAPAPTPTYSAGAPSYTAPTHNSAAVGSRAPPASSIPAPGPRPTPAGTAAQASSSAATPAIPAPRPAPSSTAAPNSVPHAQHHPAAQTTPVAPTPSPGPRATTGPAAAPVVAAAATSAGAPSQSGLHAPCAKCGSELSGTVATDAAGRSYHQACFACHTCGKVLTGDYHVMSSSGHEGDRFYCTEDFIAANSPVCAVCAQPITGSGAEDHTGAKYHLNCFSCKRCGTPITNKYIVDSKGDLCCGQCHSSSPAATATPGGNSSSAAVAGDGAAFRCGVCDGELQGQVVGVGNTRYHKHCFLCPLCKTDLTNSPFHLENGQLRCKKCLLTEKGEFCAACSQLIEEGALQAMAQLWHEQCFKCGDCSNVIGAGQSYAAKGQTPICANCATKY